MAILNRFLRLLTVIEQIAEATDHLAAPTGIAGLCALSYEILLIAGCDAPTAAVLASAAALTVHCGCHRPKA